MSRRARRYQRWANRFHVAKVAVDAVHAGVWLGLLDRDDLGAVDHALFAAPGIYRDDAYNSSGLFDWEQRLVTEHFPAGGSVLVLGAGGGREVLALAERGYTAVGYECNPVLVEYGRGLLERAGCRAGELHHVERDGAPASGGPYDAVLVGWGTYTLIVGRGARVAFLASLRRLMRDGAPLALSFFSRPEAGADRRARLTARVANALRRARRGAPVEVGDDLIPNFAHRFTADEIAEELTAAGFVPARQRPQGVGPRDAGNAVAHAAPALDAGLPDRVGRPATRGAQVA